MKFSINYSNNSSKLFNFYSLILSASRILVSAAISCSYALRDKEIDQLKDEVAMLKNLVKEVNEEEEAENMAEEATQNGED